ncbi:MAG: sulfotransferase domain-containing protein [Myxococcales bacterium]|nr:sulfotransferase domain-containing protein [Myxococcales bacterium]
MSRTDLETSTSEAVAASLIPKPARLWVSHRYRAWREGQDARACDAMVLSRAKSGRTWLRAMLSRLYQQHYGLEEAQLLEFDNFHRQNAEIPTFYFTHGQYLRKRFEDAEWSRSFGDRRIVFLVRNPCDVAVSEYFQSTKRASDRKVELYGVDRDASMFDFVMSGPIGLPSIVEYLNGWAPIMAAHGHALVVRYEDLRADPVRGLGRVSRFLDEPFSEQEIAEAVEFADFENLKELERTNFFNNKRLSPKNPDDPDSFKVRRGKVGGYADYFDAEQVETMEQYVRGHLDPVFDYFRS